MPILFQTLVASCTDSVAAAVKKLRSTDGSCMLEIKVAKGARADLGRPTTTPLENKMEFMNFVVHDT